MYLENKVKISIAALKNSSLFFEPMIYAFWNGVCAVFRMTFTFFINMYSIEMQTFYGKFCRKTALFPLFYSKRMKRSPFSHFELVMTKVIACQSISHATFSAESWSLVKLHAVAEDSSTNRLHPSMLYWCVFAPLLRPKGNPSVYICKWCSTENIFAKTMKNCLTSSDILTGGRKQENHQFILISHSVWKLLLHTAVEKYIIQKPKSFFMWGDIFWIISLDMWARLYSSAIRLLKPLDALTHDRLFLLLVHVDSTSYNPRGAKNPPTVMSYLQWPKPAVVEAFSNLISSRWGLSAIAALGNRAATEAT